MLDTRKKDNFIAVATHGNGAYTANISNSWQITDLQNSALNSMKIYPNPIQAKGLLNLELNFDVRDINKLVIINSLGQEIPAEQYKMVPIGNKTLRIQLNNFISGVYFINIETDKIQLNEKIIVQ